MAPRPGRRGIVTMLLVSLVVVLGIVAAVTARAQPAPPNPCIGPNPPLACAPASPPVLTPTPTPDPCPPDSPVSFCHLPSKPTAPPSGCVGEGCIPQPSATPPPQTSGPAPDNGTSGDSDCSLWSLSSWPGCLNNLLTSFFRGVVIDALNPLLDLLSNTLLTTPTPDQLPRIGELWNSSWEILLAVYGMLVLIAGILLMGYQTLQTRTSVKEIAPRIIVGFLAGALSLWICTKAIDMANALAKAVVAGGVESDAGETLKNLIASPLNGGFFVIFIGIALVGVLVALLVSYIVRVALTLLLVAGAPLALMFHALPQTEGIARTWWKAVGACLAIQVVQSLTLITALRVFLAPGGFTIFGPTVSGLVNLLIALAILYILYKIPFWLLSSLRVTNGRSLVGSVARTWLAYKTFGLLKSGTPQTGTSRHGHGKGPADAQSSSAPWTRPVAAARRWRQQRADRWIRPEPGMLPLPLPLRLRRPTQPVSPSRRSLADKLNDPNRVMPYQRPADPRDPALFGRRGGINKDARPPRRVEGALIPPEPGMLPLTLRPNLPTRPYRANPGRRSLADDLAQPRRPSTSPRDPGLLLRNGRINPSARPPQRLDRPLIPPEPGMLPLTLRQPKSPPQTRATEERRRPHVAPRQPALFNERGKPTRSALPLRRVAAPLNLPKLNPPRPSTRPDDAS